MVAAIMIPLDGSETATIALGAAQAMTRLLGGVLHIVHVAERDRPQNHLLERLQVGRLEVERFIVHQLAGDPVEAVIEFADRIDAKMIVMSSHGWTFNPQFLVGNTAMGIIQRSDIPVMVVRPAIKYLPSADWKPEKFLVPLNGSPAAAAGITRIFELAKLMGAGVDVLHIALVGQERPAEAGTLATPRYLDHPQYDWPSWAGEFLERFCERPPEIKLRLFHREGKPAEVILDFAEKNYEDLIVLGWLGRLEETRALTVKELLQKTQWPVLLMKARGIT